MRDIFIFVGICACAIFVSMNILRKALPKKYYELLCSLYWIFYNKDKDDLQFK